MHNYIDYNIWYPHRETEKLANDFQSHAGKQLHEELVAQDKNNKHTSYISGKYVSGSVWNWTKINA